MNHRNSGRAGILALLGSMSVDLQAPEGAIMALQYIEIIDSNHSALCTKFLAEYISYP